MMSHLCIVLYEFIKQYELLFVSYMNLDLQIYRELMEYTPNNIREDSHSNIEIKNRIF